MERALTEAEIQARHWHVCADCGSPAARPCWCEDKVVEFVITDKQKVLLSQAVASIGDMKPAIIPASMDIYYGSIGWSAEFARCVWRVPGERNLDCPGLKNHGKENLTQLMRAEYESASA